MYLNCINDKCKKLNEEIGCTVYAYPEKQWRGKACLMSNRASENALKAIPTKRRVNPLKASKRGK